MTSSDIDRAIVLERDAISRMLLREADTFTESGERSDAEGDDRNCYAARAVATNLRRLAAWIEDGEQHNI